MIYEKILARIEPINIREIVGYENDNKDEKLKESHYLITVVEQLQDKANKLGYSFATENGFYYIFNGSYWETIHENEIRHLLSEVANRLGIDKYKSTYYLFQDNLVRQFLATAPILWQKAGEDIAINLLNGTFVFGNPCLLKPFDKNDFLRYQLPFEYDKDAKAPLFDSYLDRVLPDKECQNILSEFIGYVFTKGNKQQKCLLLYGSGANGKSVFFEIIRALLGFVNVTSFSLRNLNDENCRALICNKLLNYSSEIDASINSETFKQLVSGEPIQARLKYKDAFIMETYAKLMFNCNELPKDVEYTHAYFRRYLIIPFSQVIPEEEQDKDLAKKIVATELSGIFNWILCGLIRLTANQKFTESALVNETLKDFRRESDSVCEFITLEGYKASLGRWVKLQDIYKFYQLFCQSNGFKQMSSRNFKKRLEAQNFDVVRRGLGYVVFLEKDEIDDQDEGPF